MTVNAMPDPPLASRTMVHRLLGLLLLPLASACVRGGSSGVALESAPALPAIPVVDGPLEIQVVHPPQGSLIDDIDSAFVFGRVGTGRARLWLNGDSIPVRPNGTWLAWIRLPPGPELRLDLLAVRGGDSARSSHLLRRRSAPEPVRNGGAWIDTTSFTPRGLVWWPADEPLPIGVRAPEGATVRLWLPGRSAPIELAATPSMNEIPAGVRAFDRDSANLRTTLRSDRYRGVVVRDTIGSSLGPVTAAGIPSDSGLASVEVIHEADTVRVPWPVHLTRLEAPLQLVELDDDPRGEGNTDGITVGRALPGGTYHWFFPAGTRAAISGRINGDLRLRLSNGQAAWVTAAEVRPLPAGAPLTPAVLGSITTTTEPDRAVLRLPLSWRVPYQVDEQANGITLKLYSTLGDPNWIRYGASTGPLASVTWSQVASDVVELTATLRGPLWGYRLRWQDHDLLLELRPRPPVDRHRPLAGRTIVVDPGHPPAGATGPGGLTEAEANLGVALVLERLLTEDGARVVLSRRDERPVDLWPRVRLADSLDADVLISIHNNALPDGVNPFTNNGTSVFYFHPRSIPLARSIQRALSRHLPLRELGVARGDLALVRGTWMPSVLVEGMFMMIPEQEWALRTEPGRAAYARAVRDGLRAFLLGEEM
jgi:N-acetylmuramoyl-L-alanine amidase